MEEPKERYDCRACGAAPLVPVLSLGAQSLTGFLLPGEMPRWGRLDLVRCDRCTLLQLRHTYPGSWLYTWYGYRSGINPMMVEALRDVAKATIDRAGLQDGDTVVDIGSNDGTLLRLFREMLPGIRTVGFEPATNLQEAAAAGVDLIVFKYFAAAHLEDWIRQHGKARAVTAIAMFYDLDDPGAFLEDVRAVLAEDGVFVIQMNYLLDMLAQGGFDNVSHEHVAYYALTSLRPLLARHGFAVAHVETNAVNGGSFRIWCVPQPDAPGSEAVQAMLGRESAVRLASAELYDDFARRARRVAKETYDFVRRAKAAGKRVYVYGASTRGLVIMHFCGLDAGLIDGAAERNPEKWGRRYAGTGIPCVPEEEARAKADYFLVLPWHFLDEFLRREKAFLDGGGRFIVPLPTFRVLGRDGVVEDP